MTIKIFIGSEPKTEIARKVLEFSIKQQTKSSVVFPSLTSTANWRERSDAQTQGAGTGFSMLRWDIPKRCDYEGFAIYLDADIICLCDINLLWECDVTYPNPNCSIWCTYQPSKFFKHPTPETSVMLINCKQAKFNQPNYEASKEYVKNDPDRSKYIKIMRAAKHKTAPQKIPDSFNRLNTLIEGSTNLLHYTKEPQQPWYKPEHPHRDVWENWLRLAIEEGYVDREEIAEAVAKFEPHTNKRRGVGMHPYWKKYA